MPDIKSSSDVLTVTKLPEMFAVILHNDDYTSMDFVVMVLMRVFLKTAEQASSLMILVHNSGSAEAGVYTYDIALTKKLQTEKLAESRGFPLRLTIESV